MILRELNIGDRFIHARAKNKRTAKRFKVMGKPQFSVRHGSAVRECLELHCMGGVLVNKSCNLMVIKLDEPKNK